MSNRCPQKIQPPGLLSAWCASPPHVDGVSLREQHTRITLMAQDPADGRSDIAGRQGSSGHLVQERLKQMMVVSIDQCDVDRSGFQAARGFEPAEAAADYDHVRACLHSGMVSDQCFVQTALIGKPSKLMRRGPSQETGSS